MHTENTVHHRFFSSTEASDCVANASLSKGPGTKEPFGLMQHVSIKTLLRKKKNHQVSIMNNILHDFDRSRPIVNQHRCLQALGEPSWNDLL